VWRWDQQEPFGLNPADENPSGLGTFDLPLRLPGQYADKETNLHYNYFRDYDAAIGRYVESDPIGIAWSLNLYAYVDGNPTRYGDPLGLFRMYGNWGGRNWSGGVSSPTIPTRDPRPTTPGAPVDLLDRCFMDHDRCYGSIEAGCLSGGDIQKAIAECDRRLISCIDQLPKDPSLWCAYNPLYCNTFRRGSRWWFSP
jgi:RHS repeat-associated protein